MKIDGEQAPDEALADLLDVSVDHSLHLPSAFTLRLHCHDMRWLEDPTFREGRQIELSAGERPPEKLLSGRIAVLEPELDEAGPTLVVRGYDRSHQLYRGRRRRAFTQVTDSDLARLLATEAGLQPGDVDATSDVHEYLYQNNQSNAEFLLERARRIGFELWVDEDRLNFRRPAPSGSPIRLAWGDNLRSFRLRVSTAEQVDEVEVRGWDPEQKREVVGRAKSGNGAPRIGLGKSGAEVAQRAWGSAKVATVDDFVRSPATADLLAQARLDEIASSFVEAEGTCDPDPKLVPGRSVQINGIGQRFGGVYDVTRVLHEWSKPNGLTTHFTVSGRRDRGVWSMLEESAAPASRLGLVIGLVTDNRDPREMGRIRVRFPWLADDAPSAWARLAAPMAGDGRGLLLLPEVDDEVVVGFEHGDIERPFVLGALWNGRDRPPLSASAAVGGDGKVNQRVLKSRAGHTILLDDTAGDEQITIVDKTGDNKIVFHSADNSLEIQARGDLTMTSGGRITLKGQTGVDVESQASLTLKGATSAELSSNAQTNVSGTTVKVSGSAAAEFHADGQATVSGALVQVNGDGPVQVKGTPIMLN